MGDCGIWNHFENVWSQTAHLLGKPGPRTTNHAEGWHSKINHEFGHPHPSLSTFLDWIQKSHHSHQVIPIYKLQHIIGV